MYFLNAHSLTLISNSVYGTLLDNVIEYKCMCDSDRIQGAPRLLPDGFLHRKHPPPLGSPKYGLKWEMGIIVNVYY